MSWSRSPTSSTFAKTDLVNWTVVTDGDGVLLIDAGFPGQRAEVLASLRQLGVDAADVHAILLTHAHIDHFGTAIWFAAEHGTPVYCHADEVGHAKRKYLEQASPVDVAMHAWQPRWLLWSAGDRPQGRLRARRHPDRTGADRGSGRDTARAADRDSHARSHRWALLVSGGRRADQRRRAGDGAPGRAAHGPQLLPRVFNHNEADCVRSLAALALLETDVLIPGHGEVWRGPIRDAVQQATPR